MLYTRVEEFLPLTVMGQEEVVGVGLLGNLTRSLWSLCEPFRAMAPAATSGLNPGLVPSVSPLLSSPARKARASPQVPQGHSLGTKGQAIDGLTALVFSMCMSDLAFLGCWLPS